MKKRNRIPLMILTGLVLILAGVVLLRQSVHARIYAHKVVNMLSGIDSSAIAMEGGDQSSFFQRIEQLEEALLLTRKHYYKDVEMDKMLEGAIRGAVASLDDPYSYYQSPIQKQREKEDLFQGQFGGLGIHIWPENKGGHSVVTISSVLPDKPASHAGLQAGDIIAEIEGESAILGGPNGLSMADILEKLRGRVGEPVTITIHRRNSPKPIEKTLVREVIAPKSIFSQVIEPGVVYIKLETFKRQSVNEFEEALRTAGEETKIKALIFDLRNNTGGLLDVAGGIADAFLEGGVIVSTKGKSDQFNDVLRASSRTIVPKDVQVTVLVNDRSASGSEIVAGALKDHKRAVLIGEKTYGKGLVQRRFNLESGGAVSLTISTYFTPNDVSIDGEGIRPHIEIEDAVLTEEEAFNRQRARDSHILSDYVQKFIADYEKQRNGKTPKDFTLLEPKISEIKALLDAEGMDLSEEIIRIEARSVFDRYVGIQRLIDLPNDPQLQEALRVIKNNSIPALLKEEARPPIAQEADSTNSPRTTDER